MITFSKNLTKEEKIIISGLQKEMFSDVSDIEASEDFYCEPEAYVLAHEYKEIIGYVGIYKRIVTYNNKKLVIGGIGGLFVLPFMRSKGLGKKIALMGLDYLKENGVDIAFLSVDTKKNTDKFYNKIGFINLPQKFSWTNSKGKIDSDFGGMIAPILSEKFYKDILKSGNTLYVGNGYW